jgi:hypothetical protein
MLAGVLNRWIQVPATIAAFVALLAGCGGDDDGGGD